MPRGRNDPRATTRAPRVAVTRWGVLATFVFVSFLMPSRPSPPFVDDGAPVRAAVALVVVPPTRPFPPAVVPTTRESTIRVPETAAPNPGRARMGGWACKPPRIGAGLIALLDDATGTARTGAVAIARSRSFTYPSTQFERDTRRNPRGFNQTRRCVEVCA
jgi:hypothetical protein|tara:strand:- start:1238 stop:1720 length:483 start_codon:yes stop_codon:yes gene_type:complete